MANDSLIDWFSEMINNFIWGIIDSTISSFDKNLEKVNIFYVAIIDNSKSSFFKFYMK